jgi:hypothetical protein
MQPNSASGSLDPILIGGNPQTNDALEKNGPFAPLGLEQQLLGCPLLL